MGKCVVKDCESRSQNQNKASGITFHTVPKDSTRRKKWTEIIRMLRKETDWIPTKSTLICSKHFRTEDKIAPKGDCGRVYLTDEAVPMVVETEQDIPSIESMDFEEQLERIEKLDGIIERPKKQKMIQIIKRLKFVSTNRLQKIKTLTQINKSLERKTKRLNYIIEQLKTKRMLSEN